MLLTVRNVWARDLERDFWQFLFELFGEVILENKEGKKIPRTCIIIMTHVNREKYLNEYTFIFKKRKHDLLWQREKSHGICSSRNVPSGVCGKFLQTVNPGGPSWPDSFFGSNESTALGAIELIWMNFRENVKTSWFSKNHWGGTPQKKHQQSKVYGNPLYESFGVMEFLGNSRHSWNWRFSHYFIQGCFALALCGLLRHQSNGIIWISQKRDVKRL